MPIQVTCPKCLKRFQVSEKFAGKTGPCPSCKNPIKIPDADEQVVIHEAPSDAPKDSKGQSILKPITREDAKVTKKGAIITVVCVIGVFAAAIALRMTGGTEGPPLWAQILGLIALAPPLAWAGYSFVYDRELEPYVGQELYVRVLILAAIFAALWIIYAFVPAYLFDLDRASQASWAIAGVVLAVMIGAGAFAAVSVFEVEFSGGLTISGLYFLGVIGLAIVAGVTLAGQPQEDRRRRNLPPPAETTAPSAMLHIIPIAETKHAA